MVSSSAETYDIATFLRCQKDFHLSFSEAFGPETGKCLLGLPLAFADEKVSRLNTLMFIKEMVIVPSDFSQD